MQKEAAAGQGMCTNALIAGLQNQLNTTNVQLHQLSRVERSCKWQRAEVQLSTHEEQLQLGEKRKARSALLCHAAAHMASNHCDRMRLMALDCCCQGELSRRHVQNSSYPRG